MTHLHLKQSCISTTGADAVSDGELGVLCTPLCNRALSDNPAVHEFGLRLLRGKPFPDMVINYPSIVWEPSQRIAVRLLACTV